MNCRTSVSFWYNKCWKANMSKTCKHMTQNLRASFHVWTWHTSSTKDFICELLISQFRHGGKLKINLDIFFHMLFTVDNSICSKGGESGNATKVFVYKKPSLKECIIDHWWSFLASKINRTSPSTKVLKCVKYARKGVFGSR